MCETSTTPRAPWVPYKGWRKQQCAFGSWDHACQVESSAKLLDRLVADCQAVFSARSTATSSVHSTGSTFWISLSTPPRCLLEQIAKAILQAHLPPSDHAADRNSNSNADGDETDTLISNGQKVDTGNIGAEFWTLCIDAEDAAVGFHWDLDYEAEERCGVYRTPYAGTVTYLCGSGAPTMVVEKAPTICVDGSPDNGKLIKRGWLSLPAPGKHIRFPGACLHGAPDLDDLLQVEKRTTTTECNDQSTRLLLRSKKATNKKQQKEKDGKRKKRVSLLVNIWLDGAPGFAAPLDAAITRKLSPCIPKVPFSLAHSTEISSSLEEQCHSTPIKVKRREFCWSVANCAPEIDCQLVAQLPVLDVVGEGATLALSFESGQALLL